MKYSLSSRHFSTLLKQADEIRVKSEDWQQIPDLFNDYPNATILLTVLDNQMDNFETILQYSKAAPNKFICGLESFKYVQQFIDNNISFYYIYPVNSFYDINGLMSLGVEYIVISAPLTFQMDKLKNIQCKFRMVPNVAYDTYIPRENGIRGQWVRPEDVQYYEDGIYAFDFERVDLNTEGVLFNVYKNQHNWPGNLDMLIVGLNHNIDNRAIIEELGRRRSICGQKCFENNSCHMCDTAFKFSILLERRKMNLEQ